MTTTAPLANIMTLGVHDLDREREREFYRQMEWPLVFDSEDFVAFELRGAVLTLFPVDKLAADSRAQPEGGRGGIRFAVIISAESPEQVDELADRVVRAGGSLTKPPTDAEF